MVFVAARRRRWNVKSAATVALIALLAGCAQPSGRVRVLKPAPGTVPGTLSTLTVETMPGMSRDTLTAFLGPPSFSRRDGPGELAQYRAEACVLDVFLYRDDTGTGYRVDHVEARTPALEPTPSADCLNRVVSERRRPGG